MAIIYSYPEKTTPSGGDFLVITDSQQPYPNKNRTKSLTVDNLASYVITSTSAITGGGTLNTIAMFTPDGQKIGDSKITQQAIGAGITVNTNLIVTDDASVQGNLLTDSLEVTTTSSFDGEAIFGSDIEVTGNATFEGETTINGPLYDQSGSAGALGQVLSSTSQGVAWIAGDTDTTYNLTGAVSGANDYKIVLTGSDGTVDNVNFEAGNGIELLDQGTSTVQIIATNSGTVTGTGTPNTLTLWNAAGTGIEDSILSYNGVNEVTCAGKFAAGNASFASISATGGQITTDFNVVGDFSVNGNYEGPVNISDATNVNKGIRLIHPAGGSSSVVSMYYNGTTAGSKFVISRSATGGAEIELQANGDINLNRTGNGNILLGNLQLIADEAAAQAAGLATGTLYQTDGSAAAPLNVKGIVMIKQ